MRSANIASKATSIRTTFLVALATKRRRSSKSQVDLGLPNGYPSGRFELYCCRGIYFTQCCFVGRNQRSPLGVSRVADPVVYFATAIFAVDGLTLLVIVLVSWTRYGRRMTYDEV